VYRLGEEVVNVVQVHLSLQVLEKYNESSYVAKVLSVLKLDPADPQIATEIAVQNPLAQANADDSVYLIKFLENCVSGQETDTDKMRRVFKGMLKTLLDVRYRMPPIYNLDPNLFVVDPVGGDAQIILSDSLFQQ